MYPLPNMSAENKSSARNGPVTISPVVYATPAPYQPKSNLPMLGLLGLVGLFALMKTRG